MKLVSPALLVLFAITFFGVWLAVRDRPYLLRLAIGFLALGVALFCQISVWSPDNGYHAILSAILYSGGALVFSDGVLRRSYRRFPVPIQGVWFAGIVGLGAYFAFIDPDLIARIYVINLGLGGIFLTLMWHARFLRDGDSADRALFWILVLFTLHFGLRTLLTAQSASDGTITDIGSLGRSAFWLWIQFSSSVIGVGMGIGLLAITGIDMMSGLKQERDSDPLTRLLNRRGLENQLPAIAASSRAGDVSLVVCDIDFFKKINDTHGHATGDAVLQHVAKTIANAIGPDDFVARVGGEEFVIVLCGQSMDSAYAFTETLRTTIGTLRMENASLVRSVTCSFGIAPFRSHDDFWRAVSRADAMLYSAKKGGRNQTMAEGRQVPVAVRA